MSNLDAILFCYRNLKATEFVVDNFKRCFPQSQIVLIVDKGGLDFSSLASERGLDLIENTDYNLGGTGKSAYLESNRAISLAGRIKKSIEILRSENVMILEDDVYVKKPFEVPSSILPSGQPDLNKFPTYLSQKWFGFDANWGMCGSSVFDRNLFLSIHDEVIDWTKKNHDDIMRDFQGIGCGDCFLSFHFARHGKKTTTAPWIQDGSVVHPFKDFYPPGWRPDNQVEW